MYVSVKLTFEDQGTKEIALTEFRYDDLLDAMEEGTLDAWEFFEDQRTGSTHVVRSSSIRSLQASRVEDVPHPSNTYTRLFVETR